MKVTQMLSQSTPVRKLLMSTGRIACTGGAHTQESVSACSRPIRLTRRQRNDSATTWTTIGYRHSDEGIWEAPRCAAGGAPSSPRAVQYGASRPRGGVAGASRCLWLRCASAGAPVLRG